PCKYRPLLAKFSPEDAMETAVTKKGQTNIPAAIRKRYQIHEGDRLVWIDEGEVIRVIPVPADPEFVWQHDEPAERRAGPQGPRVRSLARRRGPRGPSRQIAV